MTAEEIIQAMQMAHEENSDVHFLVLVDVPGQGVALFHNGEEMPQERAHLRHPMEVVRAWANSIFPEDK